MTILGRVPATFREHLQRETMIRLMPHMDLTVLTVALALDADLPVLHQQMCMLDAASFFEAGQTHHRAHLRLRKYSTVINAALAVL